MEEFTKLFCHHKDEIAPKGFASFKKRISSIIGVKERKSRTSIPREISIDLINSNKAYTRVVLPESDPLYFPSFKRRVSSLAVFIRNFSFSMHVQSLDLNKFRHKSLQPNNLCFSDIVGFTGKSNNSSFRKRHSFHHIMSKSLYDNELNKNNINSNALLKVSEKCGSILRRHSLFPTKSCNNIIGLKKMRRVSFKSEYTKLNGSS